MEQQPSRQMNTLCAPARLSYGEINRQTSWDWTARSNLIARMVFVCVAKGQQRRAGRCVALMIPQKPPLVVPASGWPMVPLTE
jgi:hypothetical protein